MINEFHFIRPWWLLCLLPTLLLGWQLWQQRYSKQQAWSAICDAHLLPALLKYTDAGKKHWALLLLLSSLCLMIIALAGPAWSRLPVPAYQRSQPRVVVLDLSASMLADDVSPDRLTRAKFKLHDLFNLPDTGQFGLVVYTAEPFVVAPLTEDGKTIDELLTSLTPAIMPIDGQNLAQALVEASRLISQAGFKQGQLLVLTASTPDKAAIVKAKELAKLAIYTSIMPIAANDLDALFQPLAKAGKGMLLPLNDTNHQLESWLQASLHEQEFQQSENNEVAVWRDQGRLLLIPALLLLLIVFRKNWLHRVDS